MDKFILILLGLGLAGCVLAIWFMISPPIPLWLMIAGFVVGGLILIRLVELGVRRAKNTLEDPEFPAKVMQTTVNATVNATQAAKEVLDASREISKAGAKGLSSYGPAVASKFRYIFSFSGRVSRKEYCIVQIAAGVCLIILIALILVDPLDRVSGVAYLLMILIAFILLSFGVRRTRDTGVNHRWFLLVFVPPANFAVLIFLLFVPTDEFKNARI